MKDQLYRLVKASEQVPDIWYASGGKASKRLNLIVHGYPSIGRYLKENGQESFEIIAEDNQRTVFEKESFHLIEWLEPVPTPSHGDNQYLEQVAEEIRTRLVKFGYPLPDDALTIIQSALAGAAYGNKDYEEVIQDHQRLVRELDEIINKKEGMARQASLCDIVSQLKKEYSRPSIDIVDELRKANPYKDLGKYMIQGAKNDSWNECCGKLLELRNQPK